ncbi:hypothetical protein SUGI_1139220 [Cryptomeria japonica]|nr:hypothetical protein SUGI_1139220 [Cryptomeria japonica]
MVCQSCCKEERKKKLKRGLWTPEEDRILKAYVLTYGHGFWSHVSKLTGLQRCGKSCRLRWLNYLRPGLKRGGFSHEEQIIIINAHETIGNKWSRIASMLPGRTDNEVKNFWNTHLKKKLNILGKDGSTHKTLGDCTTKKILECSSTNTSIGANVQSSVIFVSKDELNLQSSTYGIPLELTLLLATECSTMNSEAGLQDVKLNPESKSLLEDCSFMDGFLHEWLYSDQNEKPTINMASNKLKVSHSDNSTCNISYQSDEYPLHSISELGSPRYEMLNLSLPCEESILYNDLSITGIAEYWDNIDSGYHDDFSLIENLDFR